MYASSNQTVRCGVCQHVFSPTGIGYWLSRVLHSSYLVGLGLLLGLLMLLAQYVYFVRSDLLIALLQSNASRIPICQNLPCKMMPPQWSITLEEDAVEAEFNKPSLNYVTGILHNHTQATLPYPVLELTLLDVQGKLLMRRYFLAQHYLSTRLTKHYGLVAGSRVEFEFVLHIPKITPSAFRLRLLPQPWVA